MKTFDWVSLGTGVMSFGVFALLGRWGTAGAVGIVLAMHVSILLRRLPRPPGS